MAYPTFSPDAVANTIVKRANDRGMRDLSVMKLQKLVYFAQGWYLATTRRTPLIDEAIEAWEFGPVVPSLYQKFKAYGVKHIPRPLPTPGSSFLRTKYELIDPDEPDHSHAIDIIDYTIKRYGHFDAYQLSDLTHLPGAPWEQVKKDMPPKVWIKGKDIPNELIAKWFEDAMKQPAPNT